jgi:hypothetical protein
MRRAWEDFVVAETEAGSLVLFLEDLHWGDAPTVVYFDAALGAARDGPLFVPSAGIETHLTNRARFAGALRRRRGGVAGGLPRWKWDRAYAPEAEIHARLIRPPPRPTGSLRTEQAGPRPAPKELARRVRECPVCRTKASGEAGGFGHDQAANA